MVGRKYSWLAPLARLSSLYSGPAVLLKVGEVVYSLAENKTDISTIRTTCLMMWTHSEEPEPVNLPTLVCAGEKTGPTSTCSSGVLLPGPLVGCEYQPGRGQTVCTNCCSHAGHPDSRAGYQA